MKTLIIAFDKSCMGRPIQEALVGLLERRGYDPIMLPLYNLDPQIQFWSLEKLPTTSVEEIKELIKLKL